MFENLKQLMEKKGVSSYRLSKDTGIPQTTISSWMCGVCQPGIKNLKILADYFGVDIKELL